MSQPVPPSYTYRCQREGCPEPSSHCIVVHFWPVLTHRIFRSQRNSVKLFPDVVACEHHKTSLVEIAQQFLDTSTVQIREHFSALDKGVPDFRDVLIDCVSIQDALGLWADVPVLAASEATH